MELDTDEQVERVGDVEEGRRRGTLVNTSSPATRALRRMIADVDQESMGQILDRCELLAPDDFHWVAARRQLLNVLNQSAKQRLNIIDTIMEGNGSNG